MSQSYLEATARQRIGFIVDKGSFKEIAPPSEKPASPHLDMFNIPKSFGDGVIIGEAEINGRPVSILAQEGKFMGGAFGEVHSARITGLLRRSLNTKPDAVVCLWDSGGVRLQEANAGEIGVTEIMGAIFDLKATGIPVIAAVGGSCGCFGGAGIITGCCDYVIASEEARIGISGPEVIETTMGVDAFDSRDRALVWRTTGGKNRYLFGFVKELVENCPEEFRSAICSAMAKSFKYSLKNLEAMQEHLQERADKFGSMDNTFDIWKEMGFNSPEAIPEMTVAELKSTVQAGGEK
ncbi:MAG: biotin-independent malonate decarboxylase subunit beta [Lentisphaerae bacterium]|nr:biotin-independent malonate decarboxylase subunit beta [Lentisphaerota bacterium]MCP4103360.1 biotin-independent malonate decarboxylase subunit beta [Lentisphaerota bacterium]